MCVGLKDVIISKSTNDLEDQGQDSYLIKVISSSSHITAVNLEAWICPGVIKQTKVWKEVCLLVKF